MAYRASTLTPEDFAKQASESPADLEAGVLSLLSVSCLHHRAHLEALATRPMPSLGSKARGAVTDQAIQSCPARTYTALVKANVVLPPNAYALRTALVSARDTYDERDADMIEVLLALGAKPERSSFDAWGIRHGGDSGRASMRIITMLANSNTEEPVLGMDAAFGAAARWCSAANMKLLLSLGAKPARAMESPFDSLCLSEDRTGMAASAGLGAAVDVLLEAGVDATTACAVVARSPEATRKLLDARADPNRPCRGTHRPLMIAVSFGYFATAKVLLDAGAKPTPEDIASTLRGKPSDKGSEAEELALAMLKAVATYVDAAVDTKKSTLLHHAAGAGMSKVVAVLLDRGARTDRTNVYGESPLDFADGANNPDDVRALEKAGARRGDPAAIAAAKKAYQSQEDELQRARQLFYEAY
jgi:hypothetical protein